MNDLTVGIALGQLSRRGSATIRVGDTWYAIRTGLISEDGAAAAKALTLADLFLLLQADEVKV